MASKVSVQQAEQIFADALPANGQAVEYNGLVDQLEQAGNGLALQHLHYLDAQGVIKLSVVSGENGPVLHIARGGQA